MTGRSVLDTLCYPLARVAEANKEVVGIENTMRLARRYNRLIFGKAQAFRERMLQESLDGLIAENGEPVVHLEAIDNAAMIEDSGRLPHLDRLIADMTAYIEERGVKKAKKPGQRRPFFQNIMTREILQQYPSVLDFITSSDVLIPVSRYMGCIPRLSTLVPAGVRLAESREIYDDEPTGEYRESQLFHLDHHDRPMVYVIVLLRETTSEMGPFTYFGGSESDRIAKALGYRGNGVGHRMTDEAVYGSAGPDRPRPLTGPAGRVLFIDSSRCFHYGSRDCRLPRYQMMYAFDSCCRTDFARILGQPRYHYLDHVRDGDSRLRRMVLGEELSGGSAP
jgi:hypothetical protein